MNSSDEPSSARPRSSWNPGRELRSANSLVPGTIAGDMISANTRKRIQAISIDGSVPDRYFAVTSEVPRNTVDVRISAIPLNGLSVRARARRRAVDFFSGNGSDALSSLAAAAGGGVTAILGQMSNQVGHKNDNCAAAATHENRTPICADGLRQHATPLKNTGNLNDSLI